MRRALRRELIDRAMPDEREVRHEAVRYLKAHDFLRMLYKHNEHLTFEQMKRLRAGVVR